MKYSKKRLFIKEFTSCQQSDVNEYNLEINKPKYCYNIKSESGNLKVGSGIKHLRLPISQSNTTEIDMNILTSIKFIKIWHYKYYSAVNSRFDYVLVGYADDKKLYYTNIFFNDPSFHLLCNTTFTSEPEALSFRVSGDDVIGFCSKDDNMLVWNCDNDPYVITTIPKFSSICLHNGRLFVLDSSSDNLVKVSSTLNPLVWNASDATSIEMNDYKGQLKKLISFGDSVYVFRDNGISKITSYANTTLFSSSNVYSSSSKIYCNTSCICGDKMYFLAQDGLYKFDGSNVSKIDLKINNMLCKVNQQYANSCFFDGKLYIACRLNYSDNQVLNCEEETNYENNCLIEYDVNSKDYNIIRGIDVSNMLALRDLFVNKMIVVQKSDSYIWEITTEGKIHATCMLKSWESGKITLGKLDTRKVLKEIRFKCPCAITLSITSDMTSRQFSVLSSNKITRIVCNTPGSEFSFKITSTDNNFNVSNMELIFNEET